MYHDFSCDTSWSNVWSVPNHPIWGSGRLIINLCGWNCSLQSEESPFKWNWVLLKFGPCPITHPSSSPPMVLYSSLAPSHLISSIRENTHTRMHHTKNTLSSTHTLYYVLTHTCTQPNMHSYGWSRKKRNWVYIFSPKGSQEWHFHSPKLLFFKRGRETHTMRGRESKRLCFISGSV